MLGVFVGAGVWVGDVGTALVGEVIGTDDDGTVLGPAVGGALSLQPASTSTAAVANAAPGMIFIDAILTRPTQRFSQMALSYVPPECRARVAQMSCNCSTCSSLSASNTADRTVST